VKSSCSGGGGGGVSEWLESRGTLEQIDREHMTTVLTAARLGWPCAPAHSRADHCRPSRCCVRCAVQLMRDAALACRRRKKD